MPHIDAFRALLSRTRLRLVDDVLIIRDDLFSITTVLYDLWLLPFFLLHGLFRICLAVATDCLNVCKVLALQSLASTETFILAQYAATKAFTVDQLAAIAISTGCQVHNVITCISKHTTPFKSFLRHASTTIGNLVPAHWHTTCRYSNRFVPAIFYPYVWPYNVDITVWTFIIYLTPRLGTTTSPYAFFYWSLVLYGLGHLYRPRTANDIAFVLYRYSFAILRYNFGILRWIRLPLTIFAISWGIWYSNQDYNNIIGTSTKLAADGNIKALEILLASIRVAACACMWAAKRLIVLHRDIERGAIKDAEMWWAHTAHWIDGSVITLTVAVLLYIGVMLSRAYVKPCLDNAAAAVKQKITALLLGKDVVDELGLAPKTDTDEDRASPANRMGDALLHHLGVAQLNHASKTSTDTDKVIASAERPQMTSPIEQHPSQIVPLDEQMASSNSAPDAVPDRGIGYHQENHRSRASPTLSAKVADSGTNRISSISSCGVIGNPETPRDTDAIAAAQNITDNDQEGTSDVQYHDDTTEAEGSDAHSSDEAESEYYHSSSIKTDSDRDDDDDSKTSLDLDATTTPVTVIPDEDPQESLPLLVQPNEPVSSGSDLSETPLSNETAADVNADRPSEVAESSNLELDQFSTSDVTISSTAEITESDATGTQTTGTETTESEASEAEAIDTGLSPEVSRISSRKHDPHSAASTDFEQLLRQKHEELSADHENLSVLDLTSDEMVSTAEPGRVKTAVDETQLQSSNDATLPHFRPDSSCADQRSPDATQKKMEHQSPMDVKQGQEEHDLSKYEDSQAIIPTHKDLKAATSPLDSIQISTLQLEIMSSETADTDDNGSSDLQQDSPGSAHPENTSGTIDRAEFDSVEQRPTESITSPNADQVPMIHENGIAQVDIPGSSPKDEVSSPKETENYNIAWTEVNATATSDAETISKSSSAGTGILPQTTDSPSKLKQRRKELSAQLSPLSISDKVHTEQTKSAQPQFAKSPGPLTSTGVISSPKLKDRPKREWQKQHRNVFDLLPDAEDGDDTGDEAGKKDADVLQGTAYDSTSGVAEAKRPSNGVSEPESSDGFQMVANTKKGRIRKGGA